MGDDQIFPLDGGRAVAVLDRVASGMARVRGMAGTRRRGARARKRIGVGANVDGGPRVWSGVSRRHRHVAKTTDTGAIAKDLVAGVSRMAPVSWCFRARGRVDGIRKQFTLVNSFKPLNVNDLHS